VKKENKDRKSDAGRHTMTELKKKYRRMRMAINLQRPDCVPLLGNDWKNLLYSVKEYMWHYAEDAGDAAEHKPVKKGETIVSVDRQTKTTRPPLHQLLRCLCLRHR
jgi:hypothetical protein